MMPLSLKPRYSAVFLILSMIAAHYGHKHGSITLLAASDTFYALIFVNVGFTLLDYLRSRNRHG
jgi:hypothetical protein